MILDAMGMWRTYFAGEPWGGIFGFLESLKPDVGDGDRQIAGVTVKIMSYTTRLYESANAEAHKEFIDIQVVLSGEEIILWHRFGELPVKSPYNSAKDVELYQLPNGGVGSSTACVLRPGLFSLFFPSDIHSPQIAIGAPAPVRKVVVKVPSRLGCR